MTPSARRPSPPHPAAFVHLAILGLVALVLLRWSAAHVLGDECPCDAEDTVQCTTNETSLSVGVRVLSIPGLMEGDASMDGNANIIDAMFIAQYTVGLRELDEYELQCADTNDDGHVNIIDAMHMAQYTVDPNRSAGVLFMDVWTAGPDDNMLPPDWSP